MSADVNPNVTKKIAHLARLKLTDDELGTYTNELSKILDFVELLKEVNVEGVEPSIHGFALEPHFREDEVILLPEEKTKQIVACSEQPLYDQYRVPQVLGGE